MACPRCAAARCRSPATATLFYNVGTKTIPPYGVTWANNEWVAAGGGRRCCWLNGGGGRCLRQRRPTTWPTMAATRPSLRSRAGNERGLFPCGSDVVLEWRHLNYAAIRGNMGERWVASGGGRRCCWLSGSGGRCLRQRQPTTRPAMAAAPPCAAALGVSGGCSHATATLFYNEGT